jgi:hypothetical protein
MQLRLGNKSKETIKIKQYKQANTYQRQLVSEIRQVSLLKCISSIQRIFFNEDREYSAIYNDYKII